MSEFLSNALANMIGGGIGAVVVYLLIEHRLSLQQDRVQRTTTARAILGAVEEELHHNADVADALLEHLPKRAVPYSRFGMESWPLVAQSATITELSGETIGALLDTYTRTHEANEQHRLLLDLTYGATGAVAFLVASTSSESGASSFRQFDERRIDLRDRLLRRVTELRPKLDETARLVAKELCEPPS